MHSVAQTPQKQTVSPRFVPPKSGRELYREGKPITACVTPNQEAEWLDAWNAGFLAYTAEIEREGMSATAIDTMRIGW